MCRFPKKGNQLSVFGGKKKPELEEGQRRGGGFGPIADVGDWKELGKGPDLEDGAKGKKSTGVPHRGEKR